MHTKGNGKRFCTLFPFMESLNKCHLVITNEIEKKNFRFPSMMGFLVEALMNPPHKNLRVLPIPSHCHHRNI